MNKNKMKIEIKNSQRLFEIAMVVITGIVKVLFVDILHIKLAFIISAITFWIVYIVYQTRKRPELWKYWGLTFTNYKPTLKIVGFVGLIVVLGILIYGIWFKHTEWNWHIFIVLLTYPLWGTIQQFLIMSLFAGNLKDMNGNNLKEIPIILLTSIFFAFIHYPSYPLILATFLMAIF